MGTLDIALDWLRRHPGHHLFPTKNKSQPLLAEYLKASSNNPTQIRTWHAYWTQRLGEEPWWGLAPELSKIVPVDIDTKPGKSGQETYEALNLAYGPWPPTLAVETPSGGRHLWYEGPHLFALGSPKSQHPGIDFAQFILLPGCGAYKALNARPIAPAPEWFYTIAKKPERDIAETQEPSTDLDTDAAIKEATYYLIHDAKPSVLYQNGEKALYNTACWLKDHSISFQTACELLQEHYNVFPTCDPLWNYDDGPAADQLVVKVRNTYTYAKENAPGEKTPESEFRDDAPEPLTPAEKKAEKKATKEKAQTEKLVKRPPEERSRIWTFAELCDEWVWLTVIDRFLLRAEPDMMLKTEIFDKAFAYARPGKATKLSKAMFDKATKTIRKLKRSVFMPGKPEFLNHGLDYNLWRPSLIVPAQGDTTLWNAHLDYLFPDSVDRDHVLNWLAWFLQNIGLKPKHALLIAGRIQGTGKSFIAEVLSHIIGTKNVSPIGSAELSSTFNKWAMGCKLLLCEELRALERGEVAKKLHPIITQEAIPINNKNQETFVADNCFGVFAMTNDDAAIPLDGTDRRYLVVRTKAKPNPDAYYKTLYGILKDQSALGAIAWELMHRDVGAYDGQAKAPYTVAKGDMIEAGLSDLEHWIVEHSKQPPFTRRVICIDDVIEILPARLHRQQRLGNTIASILRSRFQGEKIGQYRCGGEFKMLWGINGFKPWKEDGSLGKIYMKDRQDGPAPAAQDFAEDAGA